MLVVLQCVHPTPTNPLGVRSLTEQPRFLAHWITFLYQHLSLKMPGPCSACTKLSVESLLEVARVDFQPGDFSNKAYFQHHESFNDLEKAGRQGCDFCRLVLECFQRTPCFDEEPWDWPDRWIEKTESSPDDLTTITMYSVAKGLAVSDIKLCLNATHLYSIQGFEDAKVFDEVLIQVGEPSSESQDGTVMWSCPVLRLILNTPRGESKLASRRVSRPVAQC